MMCVCVCVLTMTMAGSHLLLVEVAVYILQFTNNSYTALWRDSSHALTFEAQNTFVVTDRGIS